MRQLSALVTAFNKLVRIYGSIISATISGMLAWFNLGSIVDGAFVWLAIFFTITYGFAINDYFDYIKDSIYPDKHVIAAGLMSRRQVGIIAVVLCCLSALSTCFLYPIQQWINACLLLILTVYSWVNNRYGILANVLVAVCSALSILIALPAIRFSIIFLAGLSAFFFIFGREIIKDIHDVEADSSVRKSSVPIRYGPKPAFTAAMLLTLVSFGIALFTGFYFRNWIYPLIMAMAHILYLSYAIRYQNKMDEQHYRRFSKYSKICFLMLVPALLISLQ
jgi:4-hydroxybenzoate polyprenyltransferase